MSRLMLGTVRILGTSDFRTVGLCTLGPQGFETIDLSIMGLWLPMSLWGPMVRLALWSFLTMGLHDHGTFDLGTLGPGDFGTM